MNKVTKKLVPFMRQCMLGSKPCQRVELRQVLRDSEGKRTLSSWEIHGGSDPESMIDDIVEYAQADADGLGGLQTYALCAFDEGGTRFANSLTFRLRGDEDEGDIIQASEPATAKGQVAQAQRHTEGILRQLMGERSAATDYLLTVVRFADERQRRYEDRFLQMIEAREALLNEKLEREIALTEARNQEERQREIFEQAKLFGPAILAKLTGKRLPIGHAANKVDGLTELVSQLLDTVSDQQLGALQEILSPKQLFALQTIYEEHTKRLKATAADAEEQAEHSKANGQGQAS